MAPEFPFCEAQNALCDRGFKSEAKALRIPNEPHLATLGALGNLGYLGGWQISKPEDLKKFRRVVECVYL
jgi:hypothetical protein